MRRLFFILLILLTALRGMVGDAMAYEMSRELTKRVTASADAIEMRADRADSMPATGLFSSKMRVGMPCHDATADEATQSATPACTTCQVCHLTASLPALLLVFAGAKPQLTQPSNHAAVWVSAELQRASKPPIL